MRESKTKELRKFCDYKAHLSGNLGAFLAMRKSYRKIKKEYQKLTPGEKAKSTAFMVAAERAGVLDSLVSE